MVERKSKKMDAHRLVIRKNTVWIAVVTTLTVLYATSWLKHTVDSYLEHRFYSDPNFAKQFDDSFLSLIDATFSFDESSKVTSEPFFEMPEQTTDEELDMKPIDESSNVTSEPVFEMPEQTDEDPEEVYEQPREQVDPDYFTDEDGYLDGAGFIDEVD